MSKLLTHIPMQQTVSIKSCCSLIFESALFLAFMFFYVSGSNLGISIYFLIINETFVHFISTEISEARSFSESHFPRGHRLIDINYTKISLKLIYQSILLRVNFINFICVRSQPITDPAVTVNRQDGVEGGGIY